MAYLARVRASSCASLLFQRIPSKEETFLYWTLTGGSQTFYHSTHEVARTQLAGAIRTGRSTQPASSPPPRHHLIFQNSCFFVGIHYSELSINVFASSFYFFEHLFSTHRKIFYSELLSFSSGSKKIKIQKHDCFLAPSIYHQNASCVSILQLHTNSSKKSMSMLTPCIVQLLLLQRPDPCNLLSCWLSIYPNTRQSPIWIN